MDCDIFWVVFLCCVLFGPASHLYIARYIEALYIVTLARLDALFVVHDYTVSYLMHDFVAQNPVKVYETRTPRGRWMPCPSVHLRDRLLALPSYLSSCYTLFHTEPIAPVSPGLGVGADCNMSGKL